MLPCPKCGCPDELELDSSASANASWIDCHWCEYGVQQACDEETLVERWNALRRDNMPAWTDDEQPTSHGAGVSDA